MNRTARRVRAGAMALAARAAEDKYRRQLRSVMRALHSIFMEGLDLPKGWRQDATPADRWKGNIDKVFDAIQYMKRPVGQSFDLMAKKVDTANHAAAEKLLGLKPSRQGIEDAIARFRDDNIKLMEQAGRDYADDVRDVLEDPDTFGMGVEELKGRLLDRGSVSESRAELIARDQTLKLNANLNEMRQTNAGVKQYVWSTSNDERVRPTHVAMDGQTCSWDDPPDVNGDGEALNPGEDFQCRCVALPVLPEDQEPEPEE